MNIKKRLYYWGPPILWMTIIFILSSRQRVPLSDVYTLNFIFLKTLHLIEYATLFFLLFRAFYKNTQFPFKKACLWAIGCAILYACTDEFHQTFVPTREGSIRDILIDSIGITSSFLYTKFNLKKLERFL